MTVKDIKKQCQIIHNTCKEICSSKRKARAFIRKLYKQSGCEHLLKDK